MAYLEELPQELFYMVLSYLPTRDLSSLSRTSKAHRAIVEPIVYREIRWESKDVKDHPPPVHLLLRSLLNRPELASHINCLALCCRKPWINYRFRAVWTKEDKPDFSTSEMERIIALIVSLQFVAQNFWISALMRGEVDIFIALLISLSTNLQRLHLCDDYRAATTFIAVVLEKVLVGNSLPALANTKHTDENNCLLEIVWHENFGLDGLDDDNFIYL